MGERMGTKKRGAAFSPHPCSEALVMPTVKDTDTTQTHAYA